MYLGIDIGTSSVKTVLFDRDQRLIGQASQPPHRHPPAPGLVRAGPRGLVAGASRPPSPPSPASTASPGCAASASPARCTARSASTTTTRCCARRSSGTTAAPWPNAPRSRPPSPAPARSPATSPCRASPRRRSPGCASTSRSSTSSIDAVLLPKDYVRLRLTGHHVSEMSDAAGTFWLDVGARDWSDDLLEATGLSRSQMPRLVEGSAAFRRPPARARPPLGHRRPGGRGRRRRRQRRGGLRRRRGHARLRLRLDRHLRRALRLQRDLLAQHRRRGARLLPRHPRTPGTRWA